MNLFDIFENDDNNKPQDTRDSLTKTIDKLAARYPSTPVDKLAARYPDKEVDEGYMPDTNYTYTVFIDGTKEGTYGSKEEAKDVVRRKKEQAPGRDYRIAPKSRTSARSIKKFQRSHSVDEGNPNADPWIVWDPKTRMIVKKFITHDGGKAYASKHGLECNSAGYYYDNIQGTTGHTEEPTGYDDRFDRPNYGMNESTGLGQRVKIVKGSEAGQMGTVGEIRPGAFKGAPAYYTIDLDDGSHIQVRKDALRLVKGEVDEWKNSAPGQPNQEELVPVEEAGSPAQQAAIAIAKKKEQNVEEGWQDFNKVEPYYVCLAGKPIKKFDYYEEARRFHDNWKAKLYREGNKEKADKITLMPVMDEASMNWAQHKSTGPKFGGYLKGTDPAPTEFDNKGVGGCEESAQPKVPAPRNPAMMGDTPGRGTVKHKDLKRDMKQGKVKHKGRELEVEEGIGGNMCVKSTPMNLRTPKVKAPTLPANKHNNALKAAAAKRVAESDIEEGAKVDRMQKHIAKSEKDLGHSKKDAEAIGWATLNKRGYLDNKNKKKHNESINFAQWAMENGYNNFTSNPAIYESAKIEFKKKLNEISKEKVEKYYGDVVKKQVDKIGIQPDMYNKLEPKHQRGIDRATARLMNNEDCGPIAPHETYYGAMDEMFGPEWQAVGGALSFAKEHGIPFIAFAAVAAAYGISNAAKSLEQSENKFKQLAAKAIKTVDREVIHKMAIKLHDLSHKTTAVAEDDPCWKGYKQYGMKDKGGKQVPNCVPVEETKDSLPAHAPKGHEWDRLPEWKKEWYRNWTPGSQGVCKHPQPYHAPSNLDETAAWQKKSGKNKNGGLNKKGVASYRKEHPGSKLQTAVTKKPSKIKKGSKDDKRRKSFCARMSGNKGPMKKPNGKPTPKALALRRWHCESIEEMAQMILEGEQMIAAIKQEGWSQKYKNSINCSHPKGFSQKAHCAGKKKHNESHDVMESVCPDCGMCESHGNLNEIKKGAKDSNGFTKCWPGHHAAGTKKGKNGGQVRNCVPNESKAS